MAGDISLGQWNRTLLHRQHLLTRVEEDAIEVLDRCVGMQSQDPKAAFVGLASRIDGFSALELDILLTEREVVRMALLRGTLFLIDAEDARWIRPLAAAALDGEIETVHRRRLRAADPEAIITAAREVLAEASTAAEPASGISGAQLGKILAEQFPDESSTTLTSIARCGLPLVQIPPRGLWRGSATPTYRLFSDWVGPGQPALTGDEARRDLIRLYLRGHGPATIKGINTWAGMGNLGPIVEAMEADWELEKRTGPDGATLYDLEGLEMVAADTPAPVRLIAPFDHILVSSADRRRVADDEHFRATVTPNGRSPGFILVDGRLAGTWAPTSTADTVQISTELFVSPSTRDSAGLDAEVERMTEFYRTGRA